MLENELESLQIEDRSVSVQFGAFEIQTIKIKKKAD